MAKKEQILELLNAYKSEVDNFNDAIFTDKFEVLAQDIVKLFSIPVVIVSDFCSCDGVQDLHAMTGECRKCGKECDY